MRRRLPGVLRVTAAALALALAALGALAARDALRTADTLREDDLRFAVTPQAQGLWRRERSAPAGIVERLLEVDDDVAYRRAARLFQLSRRRLDLSHDPRIAATRLQTQAGVADAEAMLPGSVLASRLAGMTAILAFEEAATDPRNAPLLVRRSTGSLRRAIALDPTFDDAKYNLELLLRLLEPGSGPFRSTIGLAPEGGESAGASGRPSGHGY